MISPQPHQTNKTQIWDLVIVGAGVAGSALAAAQARKLFGGGEGGGGGENSTKTPQRRVLLLERDLNQPDRIVGELLQPGGYLKLKQLGLECCVDGIDAQRVVGYAMFKGGRNATVAYPTEGFAGDVAGRSFHNGRFVQRLREAAARAPGVTVRQGTVRGLVDDEGRPWDDGSSSSASSSGTTSSSSSSSSSSRAPPSRPVRGVSYRSACDGQQRVARAHLTIVCDGMYSNLRSKLSTPQIEAPSYFVGLILKGATLPAPSHGHVVLGDPSPVLFYPISSTEVRCLVDVPGDRLPSASTGDLARYLLEVIGPQVPPSLRGPFEEAVKAQPGEGGGNSNIRAMQNKLMAAAPLHTPGALLLGDSFNMRHPLTGGGMTVALGDAALLLSMLEALPSFEDPAATALATRGFYTARKPLSATINTLANALYAVFVAPKVKKEEEGGKGKPDEAHGAMRDACFDYLALGGWYAHGPISLLSGLRPRPSVLVMHFFAVACFGVGRLMLPRPTTRGLRLSLALLATACAIIWPIIKSEGVRAVFFPCLAPSPKVDKGLLAGAFKSKSGGGSGSGAEDEAKGEERGAGGVVVEDDDSPRGAVRRAAAAAMR